MCASPSIRHADPVGSLLRSGVALLVALLRVLPQPHERSARRALHGAPVLGMVVLSHTVFRGGANDLVNLFLRALDDLTDEVVSTEAIDAPVDFVVRFLTSDDFPVRGDGSSTHHVARQITPLLQVTRYSHLRNGQVIWVTTFVFFLI